ncbi:MAG: DUF1566 domain-containing protein [Myxococcales bacterium]|nr:DUF1566 domain-containing protein [Myxococcales bacterium]
MKHFFLLTLLPLLFPLGLILSCDRDDDIEGLNDTWMDPNTGLVWQTIPSNDYLTWEEARSFCAELSLAGGNWRFPAISELRTLVRGCNGTLAEGKCGVTDSCSFLSCQNTFCSHCKNGQGPNKGCYGPPGLSGGCDALWSSTTTEDADYDGAWGIDFKNGQVVKGYVYLDYISMFHVRCVR